ncbi:MAG: glycoside hydrolase domain-containing protein [Chloroflexota bacterium]
MNKLSLQKLTAVLSLVFLILSLGVSAQARPEAVSTIDSLQDFQQVATGRGWILFGGELYWTDNDGAAWTNISPGAGMEAVNFLDARRGWAIFSEGEGYALAATNDGGQTWTSRALDLPALGSVDSPVTKVFMEWQSESQGWLSFKLATSINFDRRVNFVTWDGGRTWSVENVSGPTETEMAEPDEGQGEAGRVRVSISGGESGWAEEQFGTCNSVTCTRETRLMSTRDGVHWTAIRLPNGLTSLRENFSANKSPAFADADTEAYVGQGFDKCEMAGLAQMQTWWNNSPYSAVNLYFGGVSRACANSLLSASFLTQLRAQGWRFIPTWVGLQASCTGYAHRMSSDPAVSYTQGLAEADAAIAAAKSLGLTNPDSSGVVIYLDLEAYNTGNAGCRAAANAFVNGWTERVQALGNLAGVYGASCGSAPTDWWSIAHVPDALWVANWYGNAGTVSYTPDATVWNAACLSNSLWPNHQRLRQYAGTHTETWGGVSFSIDSNVLDGPLSVPNGTGDAAMPGAPSNPSPADASTIDRASDTWLRWKTDGDTCSIHVWGGALDVTSATPCSTYHLGPQTPGSYSWQVTATNSLGSTLGPVWHFTVGPAAPTDLNATPASQTSVSLTWTLSIDDSILEGYVIYVNGNAVKTVPPGTNSTLVTGLTCNTSYSFTVKSSWNGILSPDSNAGAATTSACSSTPTVTLVSPIDGVRVNSLQPTFTWEAISGTSYYQLQISNSSSFSTLAINTRTYTATYKPTTKLLANKLYYWRVRAIGTYGTTAWSSSFFTTPNPPGTPVLVSPRSRVTINDLTPTLAWRAVTVPAGTTFDHYQLQVSLDGTFSSPVIDVAITNLSSPTYTVVTPLLAGKRYYWRVMACNTAGECSAWSTMWWFKTSTSATP